ncbi:hypothetical protein C8Q72DRAFT_880809 [Fomitopsis betulina]|nr:hypothetical protein C8Q72DRAFT_880809 [Fomitopsis betulina]
MPKGALKNAMKAVKAKSKKADVTKAQKVEEVRNRSALMMDQYGSGAQEEPSNKKKKKATGDAEEEQVQVEDEEEQPVGNMEDIEMGDDGTAEATGMSKAPRPRPRLAYGKHAKTTTNTSHEDEIAQNLVDGMSADSPRALVSSSHTTLAPTKSAGRVHSREPLPMVYSTAKGEKSKGKKPAAKRVVPDSDQDEEDEPEEEEEHDPHDEYH